MAMMLLNANATVTICHSHTADVAGLVRSADIVVAAVRFSTAAVADQLATAAQESGRGWQVGRLGERDLVINAGSGATVQPEGWTAIPTPAPPPMSALLRSGAGCARRDF
jgi:methylenetetrahydrofolate dehydrogenase (NADP+)/methenyltetrahydrofolate cyclohydrolase